MTANNEEPSMSNDDIQALLDTFMEADEEESQRMLNQHGHILLSENALQLIRDQITELSTVILPTLEKKLQLLEETKRLRADAERSRPKQNSSALLPELKDLLETLNAKKEPHSPMLDQTAVAEIMKNVPPEFFLQFLQQWQSSPQEAEHLIASMLKMQNISDDQVNQFIDGFHTSMQRIKGVNSGLLQYLFQKVWELPTEKRETFWRRDQPIEVLLDFTDLQAYIEQHNLDLSAMMNIPLQSLSDLAETNAEPVSESTPSPIDKQIHSEHIPAASVAHSFTQETTPSVEGKVPQVQDRNAFLADLLQEMQKVTDSGGSHQLTIPPELFDSIDTTNNPGGKYAQSLYRVIFMLQHSEGGRRLEDIISIQAILDDLIKTDAYTIDPNFQHLYETLYQLFPTGKKDPMEILEQIRQKNTESSSNLTANTDPMLRANTLLARITKSSQSNKAADIEQAIKDCSEAIEIFDRNHMAGGRARAYMLRGTVYIALERHNKLRMIEQALKDFEEALTFFTKENAPDEWAEIQLNRSILYQMRSEGDPVQNYENALAASQAALSVLSRTKTPFRWAAAHTSCGNAYSNLFTIQRLQYAIESQKHYNLALKVFTAENAPSEWAETLIALGRLKRTKFSLKEPRELRPDFFNRGNLFDTFKNMLQDIENALSDFTRVLDVITKRSDPYNWADAHYERAFTRSILAQNDRKQHLRAVLEDYDAALEIFTYEAYPSYWAEIQLKIATTFLRYTAEGHEQDTLRALNHLNAALTFYTREGSPLNYHRVQEARAVMYERLGQWEEARAALIEASAVQRDLITTTKSSSHLLHIIAEFTRPEISLRHAQIALRLDPPDCERAVIALEEGRTQAMRRLSKNLHQQEQSDTTPSLEIPKLADITGCITDANMALVYLAAGTNVPLGPLTNIDDHMSLGIEGGLALIVTKGNGGATHIEYLPLPHLTNLALSFLLEPVFERDTSHVPKKKDLSIPIKLEHTIAKLGEMGLNELAQALHTKGIHQVTFVPYSSLGLFPLHVAQVTLPNGETRYLGELFEVNIAPSAYAARQARHHALAAQTVTQGLKTVFSAGNPKPRPDEFSELLYAQEEALRIRDIAAEYGYQTHYLEPKQITKEQVLHALQREKHSPIGHMCAYLAVHGIYQPKDPRNSLLILAGRTKPLRERCILLGEVLDGTIDLSGIRLLILSACQTSVIDIQQIPNEAVGLASAFLQAGAVGVIASLGRVDDWATYLLMTHFAELYLGSHGKLSPARALVKAQRWLREEATYQTIVNANPLQLSASTDNKTRWKLKKFQKKAQETPDDLPFAHPKYWAAFIVTGY